MDSRPPQGNAILTAEFPPDIGESGTARYFALELGEKDEDLQTLTAFQNEADKGTLRNCMYGYLEWIKKTFLCSDDMQKSFVALLKSRFLSGREVFQKSGILCHGRVPETVSLLQLGMDLFLLFLKENNVMDDESCAEIQSRFKEILYRLARKQADSIQEDKPTHKFIRKLYALLESGQVCVLNKNQFHDFVPNNCVGYEDESFFYLHSEIAHKAVKKLCEEQGES